MKKTTTKNSSIKKSKVNLSFNHQTNVNISPEEYTDSPKVSNSSSHDYHNEMNQLMEELKERQINIERS